MDCRQITFVTLNRFCLLSKKTPPPVLLTDNLKMDRIQIKITCPFYIVFQALKVCLIKIHKSTSFNITSKKIFVAIFFNGFTQNPHPLNDQNPLSVTKVFCRCSLTTSKVAVLLLPLPYSTVVRQLGRS